MSMKGIKGYVLLGGLPAEAMDECLTYMLAGELIHIGKNTSFGFGRFQATVK